MAQVRIADLPNAQSIEPSSYIIVEKPDVGEGTFKGTVSQLQDAITVTVDIEQQENVSVVTIDDIHGPHVARLVSPIATVHDNGDGTATLSITDSLHYTQLTILSYLEIDPEPTEGSNHFVTSGTLFTKFSDIEDQITRANNKIDELTRRIEDLTSQLSEKIDQVSDDLSSDIGALSTRVEAVEDVADIALTIETETT